MTRAAKFEYIKGPVKTDIPWFRPDPHQLNRWRDEIFQIPGIENYKIWVYGGCVEDWQTWDTDIVLTGEMGDKKELQDIMISMTELGLKNRQLIDINWCNYREKHFLKGPCDHQQVSCDHYLEHGRCTPDECVKERKGDMGFVTISDGVYKNGKLLKAPGASWERLGEHLWFRNKNPSITSERYMAQKMIARIQERRYKSRAHLVTRNLDFKTIVKWP